MRDSWFRSTAFGYGVAIFAPAAALIALAWLGAPTFVFEHLIVLLAVLVAIAWGLGPSLTAAVVATFADNVLFREPFGQPTISGVRDLFDLALFVMVAGIVAWLVARARRERTRAEQARQNQDRLVAMIAHDLATPLSTIRGTVQFATEFGGHPEVDMTRLLARVETAASRATSMVRTLGDLRALDRGDFTLNLEACDYREVVRPVVEMFDRTSPRHIVTLELPDEPVRVRCDSERLQRAIENLVSNAIKYSPDGGRVQVVLAVEELTAVLTVRDEGIGISPDAAAHVFERAYRAPEASMVAPGLGLGLAITAEMVKRHGGAVFVTSSHPRGSVFTVTLPLDERPVEVPVPSPVAQRRSG
jgi:signal transduction histidine kinase